MKNVLRNWKTTFAGVVLAGTSIATSMQYITPEVAQSILTLITALGFVLAKDATQTGVAE